MTVQEVVEFNGRTMYKDTPYTREFEREQIKILKLALRKDLKRKKEMLHEISEMVLDNFNEQYSNNY